MYIEEGSNGSVQPIEGLGIGVVGRVVSRGVRAVGRTAGRAASYVGDAVSDIGGAVSRTARRAVGQNVDRGRRSVRSAAERATTDAVNSASRRVGAAMTGMVIGGGGGGMWGGLQDRVRREVDRRRAEDEARARAEIQAEAEARLRAQNPAKYDAATSALAMQLGSRSKVPPLINPGLIKSIAKQKSKQPAPSFTPSMPMLKLGTRLPFGTRPGSVGPAKAPAPMNMESMAATASLLNQRPLTPMMIPPSPGAAPAPAAPAPAPTYEIVTDTFQQVSSGQAYDACMATARESGLDADAAAQLCAQAASPVDDSPVSDTAPGVGAPNRMPLYIGGGIALALLGYMALKK